MMERQTEPVETGSERLEAPPALALVASVPEFALRLQRTAGNRATTRVLARYEGENGWVNGKIPDGWVARKRGAKTYYVSPERDKELRAQEEAAAAAKAEKERKRVETREAYVEPNRDTRRPPYSSRKVWWARTENVWYSQDSISATFTDGRSITTAARMLRDDPSGIEAYAAKAPLEVWVWGADRNATLVSFDNRRLWVFKHAGVKHVPCVWGAYEQKDKLTAKGGRGSPYIAVKGGTDRDFEGLPALTPPSGEATIFEYQRKLYV